VRVCRSLIFYPSGRICLRLWSFLDKTKLSASRRNSGEETILANFTSREGWVVGHAATGSDAWNESANWTGKSHFLTYLRALYFLNLAKHDATHVTTLRVFSCRPCPTFSTPQLPAGRRYPLKTTHERIRLSYRSYCSEDSSSSSAALCIGNRGRALGGGATRRGNADARTARLQALIVTASEESGG
jgi:hypothetical protein